MGDANKRGPRDLRVQQAIERDRQAAERRAEAERAAEAALTPEQRHRRAKTRMLMAALLPMMRSPLG